MAYQPDRAPLSFVERARKVLQHEQRTQHRDQAIKPGGVESFLVRWSTETSKVWLEAGWDLTPLQRLRKHLEGYHDKDPMERASSIRAALALLTELEQHSSMPATNISTSHPDKSTGNTPAATVPSPQQTSTTTTRSAPPAKNSKTIGKTTQHGQTPAAGKETAATGSIKTAQPASTPQIEEVRNPIPLEAGMSRGHTSLTLLSADVTAVDRVGPAVAAKLHHLGIHTIRDLLFYFPRQHRDYSKLEKIANLPFGELVTTMGLIWDVKSRRTNGGRTITTAEISDETGKLHVSWFNQPYLQKQLTAAKGDRIVVTGIKQRFGNKVDFSVRSHELPDQQDLINTGRLVPIYALTDGLNAKALRSYIKWVVDRYADMVSDHLPYSIRNASQLLPLPTAISQIHYPENEAMLVASRRRLAFDELFLIQMGMQERRSRWQQEAPQGTALNINLSRIFTDPPASSSTVPVSVQPPAEDDIALSSTLWSVAATDKPFESTLPFAFTAAQRRVICEILADMGKTKPMCRLLQGDVGAGKTAVAAAALFMTAVNGYQGAIMAPTELLAEQHARSISRMLEPFGIRTVLLTGSMRPKERAMGRAALESGEATIAIGTHALIQDDVSFRKLGLVIIDEQHRFGVEQRDALRQKGYHPHMLVMTATPIPRTLALTLYGDLDVSVIDQLPPGRQKIITRWRTGTQRGEANKLIKQQVVEGRQAFIICPLIEESEALEAKAATTEHERLQREVFPSLKLGLLHGAMKAAEKDDVMRRFRDQELHILVATSVIEVGIDIPNATVMVIEDADRFGLSQLHQFRGRVGRGQHQSYCYVLSADASLQAQDRLGVFQETDDGFRLAEEDLRLRGPGDFFGVRQSGTPELKIADLSDTALIELARDQAAKLWEIDPYLRQPEHAALRERMHLFWQGFIGH